MARILKFNKDKRNNIMQTMVFEKNTVLKDNSYYKYDKPVYDVFLSDTVTTHNPKHLATSRAAGDSLAVGFLLQNLKNVTLDFGGAVVVFHGRIAPFIIDNCENVTVKNLQITYDRPFYTQGEMLDVNENTLKMRISEGFNYRVENGNLIAVADSWENRLDTGDMLFQPFDRKTKAPTGSIMLGLIGDKIYPRDNPPMPINHLTVEKSGEDVILHGKFPADWHKGDYIAMTHEKRDKNCFTFVEGKNITLENVRIICGAAFGVAAMRTENVTLDNFSMFADEEHTALVTNNADAAHFFCCYGKIILRNCRMSGMLDDALNVHTTYTLVKNTEGKKIEALNASASLSIKNAPYSVGDTIAIYKKETQERKGTYVITDYDTNGTDTYYLTLNCVPDAEEGDLIENISGAPEVYAENCRFSGFRGLFILRTRGKCKISNCSFIGGTRFALSGDTEYWFEGGPVCDCTISDCTFDNGESPAIQIGGNVKLSSKHPYYHNGIKVNNCSFTGRYAMAAYNVKGIEFDKNISPSGVPLLCLHNCSDVSAEEAQIKNF